MSAAARATLRICVVSGLRCRRTECYYEVMKAMTEPSPRIALMRKYLSRAFGQSSGGASISQLMKTS